MVRPGQCVSCCQAGLAIQAEQPLPPAPSGCCQTRSCQPRRPCARASMVPPTEVTVGRSAGNCGVGEAGVPAGGDHGAAARLVGAAEREREPVLAGAVAVGDHLGAQPGGGALGGGQVRRAGAVALHDQDAAARAGRRDHRHVQGGLQVPSGAHPGRRGLGPAVLVDLAEAAAGHGARRQPELLAVGGQEAGQVRGVERDRHGHGLVRGSLRRQPVRRPDRRRAQPVRAGRSARRPSRGSPVSCGR